MNEAWRESTLGGLEVSNQGKVRTTFGKPIPCPDGRLEHKGEKILVGFLVLHAFRPRPRGGRVGFIDGDQKNTNLANLVWVTNGLTRMPNGTLVPFPFETQDLTPIEIKAIRARFEKGETTQSLAQCFETTVYQIRKELP